MALGKVGTKQLSLLQLGVGWVELSDCLPLVSENNLSAFLSCSHLSQVVSGASEVSEATTWVTEGPEGRLQHAEIRRPHTPCQKTAPVFSYKKLLPPSQQQH